MASRRCNDTIERNGVASKMQRDEVKDLVSKLEKRVDSQNKGVANMEAGLKQLQQLESKLIAIIRQDQKDTIARLEKVEKFPRSWQRLRPTSRRAWRQRLPRSSLRLRPISRRA